MKSNLTDTYEDVPLYCTDRRQNWGVSGVNNSEVRAAFELRDFVKMKLT